MLAAAHELGIRLIMDLVVNHTSDQHPWFIESKKARTILIVTITYGPMRRRRKCRIIGKVFLADQPGPMIPTQNRPIFTSSLKSDPDLNWNNPAMRENIYQMIRWWLDFGIDGFRLDAIRYIQKEPWDFKITSNPWAPFMNVVGIETYMAELREIFRSYDIMTVGEASGVNSKTAPFGPMKKTATST